MSIEVAAPQIHMVPDRSVQWDIHQTDRGTLLVRPDCLQADAGAEHILAITRNGYTVPPGYRFLGEGTEGDVYAADDALAIKKFRYVTSEANGGLAAVRAAVTIETALKAYDCNEPSLMQRLGRLINKTVCNHPDIRYTSPKTYAALLQDETAGRPTLLAMSQEAGVRPEAIGMRLGTSLLPHTKGALKSCNATLMHVYPDGMPGNRLVRPTPDGNKEVVILDVRAGSGMLTV